MSQMNLYMLIDPDTDLIVEARASSKEVNADRVPKVIFGKKQNGLKTESMRIDDPDNGILNAFALLQMSQIEVPEGTTVDVTLTAAYVGLLNLGRMSKRNLKDEK